MFLMGLLLSLVQQVNVHMYAYINLTNGSIFSNTSIICESRKFNQMRGQFLLLPFLHMRLIVLSEIAWICLSVYVSENQ